MAVFKRDWSANDWSAGIPACNAGSSGVTM